ncbi:hypothetical protein [Massilia endophytica]|uniref:hypothetical protein n=1 Tax=Massilia endophytica TaxID=2899220 RepID=UPI001E50B443|nr:hypothetical protein [Massilia endophytica]UGQ47825.1 hypothetical protein LSQ66_04970 [Massilia endophytica]
MDAALKRPIKTLPFAEAGTEDVLVEVRRMTWDHVNVWHSLVQPIINANFRHWHSGIAPGDARADVGWDWGFNYALALLHNAATYVPGNASGPALAMAVTVATVEGREIPIGMLTVVPQFQSTVERQAAQRSFAWYLADAPKAFYTDVLGAVPVKGVASALLDCAVQSGFDAGGSGDTLLHADPHGGEKLQEFYVQRCGMRQVGIDNGPISLFRRRHTDQYFHMDAPTASGFSQRFDARR